MSDPAALRRLEDLLDELCMDIAELNADSADHHSATVERAAELKARVMQIRRMAGLPDRPGVRVERHVRKVSA